MREKAIHFSKNHSENTSFSMRKLNYGPFKERRFVSTICTYHNDNKVYKALLNRVSELALLKVVTTANHAAGETQNLLSSSYFSPIKNMAKRIQIAGVNLTIDPSLPTFENDVFLEEKTKLAIMKFSNQAL